MNPAGQVTGLKGRFARGTRVRLQCWLAGTIGVLGVVLALSCGGGTQSQVSAIEVSISPLQGQVALRGQVQFTSTLSGSNAGVQWSVNGAVGGDITVGVISSTGLYSAPNLLPSPNTVTVAAASVAAPTTSSQASLTIVNPAPSITSLSPATIGEGSGNTTVTVTGTGFTPQSSVEVEGLALSTLYWNPTALTASVPAAQLAQTGNLEVQVATPTPGGGTSAAVILAVSSGAIATANLQVALYSYYAPQDASVFVEFGTDTNYGLRTWAQNTPPGGGLVQILVAGMKANTIYHMRAVANSADGTQTLDQDHTFTTGGPPAARVPATSVTNPNGLAPSPGAILLHLLAGTSNQLEAAAVDNAGNLIWYYDYDSTLGIPDPIKLLPNGHMLANLSNATAQAPGVVREIDLAGNVINQFTAADLNNWLSAAGYNLTVYSIHHDFLTLPNGHLILLVNHYENFIDLPGYPGTTSVLGDALVDLDPNHNPVWVWDTFDHLDVNRHPMNFPDWTHCNAIFYSADDGNLLLSSRHQSWVMKIDYQNGQGAGDLLWRLGYQGDFTLTNGQNPDWFYAQHYANVVSPNTTGVFELLLFDNGDDRVVDASGDACGTSGQPACYSRVPILQVDETAMTATLLWQDNLSPVYSFWGGSAQQLGDGDLVFGMSAPSDDPTGARYMEVTSDPTPQVVLQMEVSGQNAYRAVHLPSLYPGVQW